MTDSEAKLSLFSFLKKPISALQSHHLAISDILPSASKRQTRPSNQQLPLPNHQPSSNNPDANANFLKIYQFNNINHDEQIRAPRMTNANYYTYQDKSKIPLSCSFGNQEQQQSDNETLTLGENEKDSQIQTETKENKQHSDKYSSNSETLIHDDEDNYSPAVFDLNQPTRRFSTPSSNNEDFINTDVLTLSNVSLRDQRLMDALNNLNVKRNINQAVPGRIKNRPTILTQGLVNTYSLQLQQLYLHKKPLSFPAVLRPTPTNLGPPANGRESLSIQYEYPSSSSDYPSSVTTSPEIDTQQRDSLSSSPTTPNYEMKGFPFIGGLPLTTNIVGEINSLNEMEQKEPTHEHWKPNNFTTNCMKCFDTFGNFFTPLRKRRHHCRYCGQIVCFDCSLQPDENSGDVSHSSSTGTNTSVPFLSRSKSFQRNNNNDSNSDSASDTNTTESMESNSNQSSTLVSEMVGGVLLDANANFIIPLFENIVANDNQLNDSYKYCRVCKDCGSRYKYFVNKLNSEKANSDHQNAHDGSGAVAGAAAPFVVIENPYIKQYRKFHGITANNDYELKNDNGKRNMSVFSEGERKESVLDDPNAVPTDWTWSSF